MKKIKVGGNRKNWPDVFEYDIYNCPQELKGRMKIGDFSGS